MMTKFPNCRKNCRKNCDQNAVNNTKTQTDKELNELTFIQIENSAPTLRNLLKLGQINLQNNKTATANLIKDLIENNYIAACIQDAYLVDSRPYGIPSSTSCYSSGSKNCHILIFRDNLKPIQILQNINSVFVNLELIEGILTLGCQYSPPSANLSEDLQEWTVIPGSSADFLLLGDLNAHSVLWGYPSDNVKGHQLLTFMHTKHLISVNDPHSLPTFESTHLQCWPGITLSSTSQFPKIKFWEVDRDLQYGDHRLISIYLDSTLLQLPKRRFRTKNVCLNKFDKLVLKDLQDRNLFQSIIDKGDFDKDYEKFLNLLLIVCGKTLKKKNTSFTPKFNWWSEKLRKSRNYMKALYRKSRHANATLDDKIKFKKQRAQYKKELLQAKKVAWENLCKNTKEPWSKTKILAFQEFHRNECFALSNSTIAPQTRQAFFDMLTNNIFGTSVRTPPTLPSQSFEAPQFTIQEIKWATHSFNTNKAPGIDNINHIISRRLFKLLPTLYKICIMQP